MEVNSFFQQNPYIAQITIPLGVLFFEILLHLGISRFWIKKGTILSTMIAYNLGVLLLFYAEFRFHQYAYLILSETLALTLVNFVFYSALAFFYFSFVNIGETSVRIRVLRELAASSEGISTEELLKRYNVNHIIQMRVDRMLNTGEMIKKDDRYYYSGKPKMFLIAKTCQRLKVLLLGKRSFDSRLSIE